MIRIGLIAAVLACASAQPAAPAAVVKPAVTATAKDDHTEFGRFGSIALYRPAGAARQVVLLLSGEAGWDPAAIALAEVLRDHGVLVAGLDMAHYRKQLDASGDACSYPAADFEQLSHWLQSREGLAQYRYPILVGEASGAAWVYALLAQGPAGTFAGGLSLDFCPQLDVAKPLCAANALTLSKRKDHGFDLGKVVALRDPWRVSTGRTDPGCTAAAAQAFVAGIGNAQLLASADPAAPANTDPQWLVAFDALAKAPPAPTRPAGELGDLPLVEVPASAGSSDLLAVLLTGDGGWAGLDQDVATALSARGIPVVALNSLKYFWTPRTPDGTAADVDRIARHYLAAWGKRRLVLVGYSQGADVLPFVISRLAPDVRAKVATAAMIGLSKTALFTFKVTNWLGNTDNGLPTVPELDRVSGVRLTCIYGAGDADAICENLPAGKVTVVKLPGGHHFNGDFQAVAQAVLEGLQARSQVERTGG